MTVPQQSVCRVYHKPLDVRNALTEFNIPKSYIVDAAQAGFVERLNATVHDPVTAAGTDAWRYAVRSFRSALDELGWRQDDPKNLPLSINDELRVSVTVSSGDRDTGKVYGKPKTKNPKGALFDAAIARNTRQPDLFPDLLPEAIREFSNTVSYKTWVLLIFISETEIRAELSLPSSMDHADRLCEWSERIIIDVPLPDEEKVHDDVNDDDDKDDFLDKIRPKF